MKMSADDQAERQLMRHEDSTRRTPWSRISKCFRTLLRGADDDESGWITAERGRSSDPLVGGSGDPVAHPFVIHPENWWYKVWKHIILVWAVYSSFFTPMEFGFFRGLAGKLFLLDIAGQIAFLIDIAVQFSLAYRDTHSYCMVYDRKEIAKRYLKSRFTVDFLGCMPWDEIYKAVGRKEPVRYLLWIRLTRAYRITEFFERLEKDIRINYHMTRIVKLFVVELYATHTAACIFYYLATTVPPSQEGYTWIGSLKMGDFSYAHFRDIDLWKRYVTSLYFAVVTMATVGYGEIHAVNVREMIFVMLYVSFDMILSAYLLGNMTALIVKGSRTERFRDKMTDIMKYMNRNKVDRQITRAIKGHLRLQFERRNNDTSVLQDVPTPIRTKISQNLYDNFLQSVPFFKGCSLGFIKLTATRVDEEFFLPGEVVIEQGMVADQLYFVGHGELEEVSRNENDGKEELVTQFHAYSSFPDVSFLCDIPQPYTVRAHEFSRVLRLDKQSFKEILEIYFLDGRIILKNFLELCWRTARMGVPYILKSSLYIKGQGGNMQKRISESDITLDIAKHEIEQATRVNCAAYMGDLYRLKRLIDAGGDPNNTDYDRRSPLHICAAKGYADLTDFLIKQGVRVNITDSFGNTPLMEAIKNGHDEVAALLLNAGATLTIDEAGNFLCIITARKDRVLLERILACGISPNSRNYDQRTPLHIAASEGLVDIAELLVEKGASVLLKDRWGNTALDEACKWGDEAMIKLLEASRISRLTDTTRATQDELQRKKCTVFPFHPWDYKEERTRGIVLWVPHSIDELITMAMKHLHCSGAYCILSQNGGKIVDVDVIENNDKLYLVND